MSLIWETMIAFASLVWSTEALLLRRQNPKSIEMAIKHRPHDRPFVAVVSNMPWQVVRTTHIHLVTDVREALRVALFFDLDS